MTLVKGRLEAATPREAAVATTFDHAPPLAAPGLFRRTAVVVGDLVGAAAILLCIPLAILAIGTPIVLGVRLLSWMAALR